MTFDDVKNKRSRNLEYLIQDIDKGFAICSGA